MASESEIAWAAGVFEGEGSFYLYDATKPSGTRYVYPRAKIAMTDRDVVVRVWEITGLGRIGRQDAPSRNVTGRKPVYVWDVCRTAEVRELVRLFSPWLGERRMSRAMEILAAEHGSFPPGQVSLLSKEA